MTRISLSIEQESVEYTSPWVITNLIDKISINYYKQELITQIANKLKKGVSCEQIFILDESFNINRPYGHVGEYNLLAENDAKHFYHLGKPISIYPNKNITIINIIFDTFSEIYTYFNTGFSLRPDKSEINKIIEQSIQNSKTEMSLIYFEKIITEKISGLGLDSVETQKIKKYTDGLFDKARKDYIEYIDNEVNFEVIEKYMEDGIVHFEDYLMKDEAMKVVYNKYYQSFSSEIKKLSRPIVGVYYKEEKKIEILCANFLKNNVYDEKQFDLKEVKHNSPFLIVVLMGIAALPLITQLLANHKDSSYIKKEQEGFIGSIEEVDAKKTVIDKKFEEILKVLEDYPKSEEYRAIEEIDNEIVKTVLEDCSNVFSDRFQEGIKDGGFLNEKLKVIIEN